MQMLDVLSFDASSQIIGHLDLHTILKLPHNIICSWLRGCQPTYLLLTLSNLTSALLQHLARAVPCVPLCSSLTLDMNISDSTSWEGHLGSEECQFFEQFASHGRAQVCSQCSCAITSCAGSTRDHKILQVIVIRADTNRDHKILQVLGMLLSNMPALTHMRLMNVPCTAHVLSWLQTLGTKAPRLKNLALSAQNNARCSVCGAIAVLQSFEAIPQLQEVDLTEFGRPLFGCMLVALVDHPTLKYMTRSRAHPRSCAAAVAERCEGGSVDL